MSTVKDVRLKPWLTLSDPEVAEEIFALGSHHGAEVRKVRITLLANLLLSLLDGRTATYYSRDRSHYSRSACRFYSPNTSYRAVLAAVTDLVGADLATERRQAPGSRKSQSSTLSPTARFREIAVAEASDLAIEAHPVPLHLKDDQKRRVAFESSRSRRRMAAEVAEQNAFLRRFSTGLVHERARDLHFGCIEVEGEVLVRSAGLYRVFNRDFSHGGRWYGGWFQRVRSSLRAAITIDGEPTIEEDFKTMHPRLLEAAAGLNLPFGSDDFDFYAVGRFSRAECKLAFNVLLNADSRAGALTALRNDMDQQRAGKLITAFEDGYPRLAPYWFSGVGLRLQRIDAEICGAVLRRLREAGIPALAVHDSFVSAVCHQGALLEAMDDSMDWELRRLRTFGLRKWRA